MLAAADLPDRVALVASRPKNGGGLPAPPSSPEPAGQGNPDLQGWGQPRVNADMKTSQVEQDHLHI